MVALSFVSVLLVLIYGPAAPWFVAADRFLYDQMAGHVGNKPLENGVIVSINGGKMSRSEILSRYGRLVATFKDQDAKRIVLANPPEIEASADLPGWAAPD